MNAWATDRTLADVLWREWPIVGARSVLDREKGVWLKKPTHPWREQPALTWDDVTTISGVEFWGFKTGPVSEGGAGIILIEFDGEVGEDTFSRLGLEPNARSGSGGAHLYIEAPPWYVAGGQKNKKWDGEFPGMDVRGWHQLAYFHGTSHKGTYQLLEPKPYPVSALPQDLARVLGLLEPPAPVERPEWDGTSSTDWGMAALASECRVLTDAATDRLLAAYNSGLKIGNIVAADSLDGETARDALMEACRQNGAEEKYGLREVERAIDNGMKQGVANGPRGPKPVVLGQFDPKGLPDEFWAARPYLAHVRQAAYSRGRSGAAVLQAVLARVAASTPYYLRLPPTVGTPASLSYFGCGVAAPGSGKSDSNGIAAELIPVGSHVADQLPLGSGEGLVEALFEMADDPANPGGKKVKAQVRHNAFVYVDEGQLIGDFAKRTGTSLMPTLRSIWSGQTTGQQNASLERRRVLPGGTYVYGVYVGLQESNASALLDDRNGGTPQRFGWARATDPMIPAPGTRPDWPGALEVKPLFEETLWTALRPDAQPVQLMELAESIKAEIQAADYVKATGVAPSDGLDGHSGLYRLKVAGLLAILDGRLSITEEDWRLAGMVQKVSDGVRDSLVARSIEEVKRQEFATARRLADRAVMSAEAVERRRIVDCARKVAGKVHAEPERWTVREMRMAMRNYREIFDDALEHALTEGWINEATEPGQGTAVRTLRPGVKVA